MQPSSTAVSLTDLLVGRLPMFGEEIAIPGLKSCCSNTVEYSGYQKLACMLELRLLGLLVFLEEYLTVFLMFLEFEVFKSLKDYNYNQVAELAVIVEDNNYYSAEKSHLKIDDELPFKRRVYP